MYDPPLLSMYLYPFLVPITGAGLFRVSQVQIQQYQVLVNISIILIIAKAKGTCLIKGWLKSRIVVTCVVFHMRRNGLSVM